MNNATIKLPSGVLWPLMKSPNMSKCNNVNVISVNMKLHSTVIWKCILLSWESVSQSASYCRLNISITSRRFNDIDHSGAIIYFDLFNYIEQTVKMYPGRIPEVSQ